VLSNALAAVAGWVRARAGHRLGTAGGQAHPPRRVEIIRPLPLSLLQTVADRRTPALRQRAEARGMALLQDWLSPAQAVQFVREQHFDVIGSASGKRYRIYVGTQFNVESLDDKGNAMWALCFAPEGPLAIGDVMLAQKIALETDELKAIAVANAGRAFNGHDDMEYAFSSEEARLFSELLPRLRPRRRPPAGTESTAGA
jgi:hypothetical protein